MRLAERDFRALLRDMLSAERYPDHASLRDAMGSRNTDPQLRSGLTHDQTRWRIDEIERVGFDWEASKKAGHLVARHG